MIEELTDDQTAKLEDGTYRWVIDRNGPLGVLQVSLQRKRWIGWCQLDVAYPEYADDTTYLYADVYRRRVEAYKGSLIDRAVKRLLAHKAEQEFFSKNS